MEKREGERNREEMATPPHTNFSRNREREEGRGGEGGRRRRGEEKGERQSQGYKGRERLKKVKWG